MASETTQTITRLTPLAEVLAVIEREVKPVGPRNIEPGHALEMILAADVTAPLQPKTPIAIMDGWALAADSTLGAGGYSPLVLPAVPQWVNVGQPIPPGSDCVAPPDAVKITAGAAEVLGPGNPGDGVLPAGGDCDGNAPLRRKGDQVRLIDVTAFCAAGVAQVTALAARVVVLPLRQDRIIGDIVQFLRSEMVGVARPEQANCGCDLAAALALDNVDAVVAVGGTGQGRDDRSVATLASKGRVAAHGIALSPGESAAFGFAGGKPVLLLPGRVDAALAVWLTIGRPMMRHLAGRKANDQPGVMLTLTRKISSTVGLAEFVPVRCIGDKAEPLATKYLPLSALAQATGWILVLAESEGYAAGAPVQVMPWP